MKARYALAILSALSLSPLAMADGTKTKKAEVNAEDYRKKAISTFKEYLGAMILKDYSRAASLFSNKFYAGGRSEMVDFKTEKITEMLEKSFGAKDYSQLNLEKIIKDGESGNSEIFSLKPLKELEGELRKDWRYAEKILPSDYTVFSKSEGDLPMHKAFLLRCTKAKEKCKIIGIF